jgi:type III restriction enzyme
VKKYVIEKLFKEKVDLDDPRLLFNLSSTSIQTKLVGLFVSSFRDKTFIEKEPQKIEIRKLSKVSPFVTTKLVYPANKSIFNYIPCDSNFEIDFAKFLDSCEDVEAFSKIVVKIGFSIEYVSDDNLRRYYYPDFVVKSTTGEYYLIETKGLIDLEVAHKDKRAKQWCKDASDLTGDKWEYYRIDQDNFEKYRFKSLKELISALSD